MAEKHTTYPEDFQSTSGNSNEGFAYPAAPPYLPPPPYMADDGPLPYRPSVITPPPYTPSVPIAPPPSNWCENNMRNKPQSNSIGAASLLFIVAGMNMSWSAFNPNATNGVDWFIGAMIGAWVGAAINTTIKRKYLIMFSAVLTIVNGIMYITVPNSNGSITAARYFDGLAVGVVFVPTMVLIGEESVPYMRGMLASCMEVMCIYIGISIQTTMNQTWEDIYDFSIIQMQGTMNVTFGFIALIISSFMYIESPVYYLTRDEEEKAIDSLRRLQSPFMVTTETYEQLRNLKVYVEENQRLAPGPTVKQALPGLFMLMLYRVWLALTFSALTCAAIVRSSTIANNGYSWELMVIMFGNMGIISALLVCFVMDSWGRVQPTLIGSAMCGILALAIGLLWDNVFNIPLDIRMMVITYLLLIFQFFAPISTVSSTIYLTEAFPLSIKSYFISFPFVAQMLAQLIVNSNYNAGSLAGYFYASAIIGLIMAVLAATVLPETKKLSLWPAQVLFRKLCCRRRQT